MWPNRGIEVSEAVDRSAGLRDLGNFSLDLVTANPSRSFPPLLAVVLAGAYSSVRVGMVRTETVCRA
jgi:hypothetical protein